MTNLDDFDLRDPAPPVPGDQERAAVATRAHQLGRRRRILQGAGALGMVAAVAVGVAALTAGGTSSGTRRIEAASSAGADDTPATTTPAVATTTVPAPTPVPAPTADTGASTSAPAPAPVVVPEAPPVAPSTFTVSGTVGNIPAGATVTVTLHGANGSFSGTTDGSGHFAIAGVPAGAYDGIWDWDGDSGTAAGAGRLGGITVAGDVDVSFDMP